VTDICFFIILSFQRTPPDVTGMRTAKCLPMNLDAFINHLVREGQVTVVNQIIPFTFQELQDTQTILAAYYESDILEMPGIAPAFDADAALWAAGYIYRIVQLTQLREAGREDIVHRLPPYSAETSAASIYSADLCLRYLPDLLSLSKGIAPDGPLVQQIREIAMQWPFSSTGMNLPATGDVSAIIASPPLLQAYADRIIATRDLGRCNIPAVAAAVTASLGNYASVLWPDYKAN
jgi:MoxR-vWA-beta-propeller ternary system domain bpX4